MTDADPVRALLDRHEAVAAFCPVCGGWTMFVTTNSSNARDWVRRCHVAGDLIIGVRSGDGLGPACPQVDTLLDERTCDR